MSQKSRGWYQKFQVRRTDRTDVPGGKHDGCEYFVLDLTHDLHALPALVAYAESCAKDYPKLADDLRKKAANYIAARRSATKLIEAIGEVMQMKLSPEVRGKLAFALASVSQFKAEF